MACVVLDFDAQGLSLQRQYSFLDIRGGYVLLPGLYQVVFLNPFWPGASMEAHIPTLHYRAPLEEVGRQGLQMLPFCLAEHRLKLAGEVPAAAMSACWHDPNSGLCTVIMPDTRSLVWMRGSAHQQNLRNTLRVCTHL